MRDAVLRYIRRLGLMGAGDRVLVAVSGGADSVALLRLLLEIRWELGIVLAVAHFNHLLRGENSDADEHFVGNLAVQHDLPIYVERKNAADSAQSIGLEAAGRKLRYEWLTSVAIANRFDAVVTAHTLDDQAETALMRFLRGSGTKGLAGVHPEIVRGEEKKVRFVRPLLQTTRSEIEAYLESLTQPWREDESNLDHRFLRNRVRHELLPRLERDYNPKIRRVLSETAEINRAEGEFWNGLTEAALRQVLLGSQRLRLGPFAELDVALQRRVLKRFLETQEIAGDFHSIEAARGCAFGDCSQAELTEGWILCREADALVLKHRQTEPAGVGYSYKLPIPGEIRVPEIGCVLRAVPVPAEFAGEAEPGTLLNADHIGPELIVRNWSPGDRFHPAYSGSEEKLKRLFAENRIAAESRSFWPLALNGQGIVVWVRGFRVAKAYCWRSGDGDAIRLECGMLDGTV